jgi:hypothetical protein
MAENIVIRINDSLKTLWNIDDPIYKSVICDADGTILSTITIPTDIDIGAIASGIEYLRRLSIDLSKQIYFNQADTEFLKYVLNDFFNIQRFAGESDAQWLARAVSMIFKPRVSRATIIYALRPYSDQEPEIISGDRAAMFADYSFADRYKRDTQTFQGSPFPVFPAYAYNSEDTAFSLIIVLYGTDTGDILNVVNLLQSILVAGVSYTLEIR